MAERVIEQVLQIAVPIVIASIPVLVGVAVWRRQRRWEMRRDACLKALDVIDAAASHFDWGVPAEDAPHRQPNSISKVRRAYAELCVSCRAETVDAFLRIFNMRVHGATSGRLRPGGGQSNKQERHQAAEAICQFRGQVRTELGFRGEELVHMTEEAAILSQLPGTSHET